MNFMVFMSRKARVLKRPQVQPDRAFNSILVQRLINRVMLDGKKSVAAKIVTDALTAAAEELKVSELEVIERAVDNTKPKIEVKSMRVGGASYQVPVEPYAARALRLSLTWIVNAAREMKDRPMADRLKSVLVQSFNGEGPAVDKRNVVHQLAAGNKAFAHFAFLARRKKK
jgi:small subunit ribosomal protein S7